MKFLRVIDDAGNKQDFETDWVPRIGESVVLEFGRGAEPVKLHYFRVTDVMYRLDNEGEHQAAVHLMEEANPLPWA